jgi:hypothetical protein
MPHTSRKSVRDIRLREIVSLEQQRLVSRLGKGISETVSEIQLGRMATAVAEVAISLARGSMYFRVRYDLGKGEDSDRAAGVFVKSEHWLGCNVDTHPNELWSSRR